MPLLRAIPTCLSLMPYRDVSGLRVKLKLYDTIIEYLIVFDLTLSEHNLSQTEVYSALRRKADMATDKTSASRVSPDEAFALVADETRLEILRMLAATDEPLAFSTLFHRSEYDTRSNFSYHLDKLDGHFISQTDEGYALRQAGRRVVEAVISGAVTDDPVVHRVPIDRQCPFCSAQIEVSYE